MLLYFVQTYLVGIVSGALHCRSVMRLGNLPRYDGFSSACLGLTEALEKGLDREAYVRWELMEERLAKEDHGRLAAGELCHT